MTTTILIKQFSFDSGMLWQTTSPLQEKARSLAQNLDLADFKASYGWLEKWKSVAGEENACTSEMTASWKETHLPTILSGYELKDIFNADEFGLFYQAMPNKSLHFKGERR